ncbi:MAG: TauD/TfdA family dioxygenase [Solirubrobacterales bacterium]
MRNVELSTSVTNHLESVAAKAGFDEPPRSVAARLAPLLPDDVHDALIAFRQGHDQGAVFLRGVGPGEVPTSAENYTHLKVAPPLLLGLVSLIATPVSARNEWDGGPLTDIKVTTGLEDTVSSKGKGTLPLHQEDQHLDNPPDGLALLTVRGGSPTRLAPTPEIIEALRVEAGDDMVETLRQPNFRHRMPDSFEGLGWGEDTAILFGSHEMPELKVDLTTTEAISEEGRAAMAALVEATDLVATDLDLTPGNLLIFDNRRWLHGRGKTIPTSSERWLLRSLFVYDSWRTQNSDADGGESELVVYA